MLFYFTDRDMEEQLLGDDDAYENEALMNGQEEIDNGDILNGENGEPKVSYMLSTANVVLLLNHQPSKTQHTLHLDFVFLADEVDCLGIR